jgi:carboxymethylenebutenolidase
MPDQTIPPLPTDQPTLAEVWVEHTAQEFIHRDVEATLRTMTDTPQVIAVALATGGRGREAVRDYYARHFIGRTPQDTRIELLSRTVGGERVVDEMILSFTHDIETPWILPGIAPTGRHVEIPIVAIVTFQDGKIHDEHLYWDQASVLAQTGLITATSLTALGIDQAKVLRGPTTPLNIPPG